MCFTTLACISCVLARISCSVATAIASAFFGTSLCDFFIRFRLVCFAIEHQCYVLRLRQQYQWTRFRMQYPHQGLYPIQYEKCDLDFQYICMLFRRTYRCTIPSPTRAIIVASPSTTNGAINISTYRYASTNLKFNTILPLQNDWCSITLGLTDI